MSGTTISGTYASGFTLNSAAADSPVTVFPGAKVTANAGAAVYGTGGGGSDVWTVTNSGTLSGQGSHGHGIQIGSTSAHAASGTVTNLGVGSIYGYQSGVAIYAPGSVDNLSGGTISGGTLAGNFGVLIAAAGTVSNAGRISDHNIALYLAGGSTVTNLAGGVIAAATVGVSVAGSGSVTNAGTIIASTGRGVYLGSSSGPGTHSSVTNQSGGAITGAIDGVNVYGSGTIVNNAGGTIDGATGVRFEQGTGTITNAGVISGTGGTAILFGSSTGNLVIALPGAAFDGAIGGGGGVMELASGGSAGTLTGFGPSISNFGRLRFDAGAAWMVGGNANAAGLGSIAIYGFAHSDTIDLIGFAATSVAFAGNALVLTDASAGYATLHIHGNFLTSDFQFTSDQAGGTDITPLISPPQNPISGSHSSGIMLSSLLGSPVSVTGTILVNGATALYGPGGGSYYWTINNSGVISSSGGSFDAVALGASGAPIANGVVTNQSGGTISGAGGINIQGPGSVTNLANGTITGSSYNGIYMLDGGDVANYGVVTGVQAAVFQQDGGFVGNFSGGTLSGTDGVYIGNGVSGTVANGGVISGVNAAIRFGEISNANSLVVYPGAQFNGSIDGLTGAVELISAASAGSLGGFGGLITDFSSLSFDAGAAWSVTGNDQADGLGTIAMYGFATGDTIDLTGVVATGGTWASDTLTLTDGATTVASLHMVGSFTDSDFVISNNGSDTFVVGNSAPCYRAGTGILTPSGEVLVEQLAIGDLVVTRSGEAKPVKWIGRRGFQGRFIAGNLDVLPIRIAAGALADGIPNRDLDVSPKHAMLIDDVLVPAEFLVNGASVYQLQDVDSVEYFHIELASHDVITANGAASETFVDCDSRGMFSNAADYQERYPGDPGPVWQFCAPRVDDAASPALGAILARLPGADVPEGHGPRGPLQGNIECCDRTHVKGWAFDPAHPREPVRLEIRCDGAVIGCVVADRHRADLAAAGYLGDGCCSFSFQHPIHLLPLSAHTIEIQRASDGAPMPGSPVVLPAAARLDDECRSGFTLLMRDVAEAAAQPSDLDDAIGFVMAEAEALLSARARLDTVTRADVTELHQRWGGLLPTTAPRRVAPEMRPRALFVDDQFPEAGTSVAIDHMRALARIGFDVCFAASRDLADGSSRAAALATLGVRSLVAPWYASIEEMLRRHAERFDLVYLHRAGNAAAYGKLVRQYCPAALLVHGVAELHRPCPAGQVTMESEPDIAGLADLPLLQEMIAVQLAHVVITRSEADAALLRVRFPGVSVSVVPWSVPVRSSKTAFAERDGVAFVADFTHQPDVDAVHWLAREIAPLVQAQEPTIGFRIVGHEMPEAVRRLARPGLELVGSDCALDAVLDATRLTAAPLHCSTGLRAAVLASLAAGVPCVGTAVAYDGMTLPLALTGCVADTPEAFAAALIRLYRDETAHAAAAEAGRRYVLVNHAEGCVDALMQQALAPALRRWAGIAGATDGHAAETRLAG